MQISENMLEDNFLLVASNVKTTVATQPSQNQILQVRLDREAQGESSKDNTAV